MQEFSGHPEPHPIPHESHTRRRRRARASRVATGLLTAAVSLGAVAVAGPVRAAQLDLSFGLLRYQADLGLIANSLTIGLSNGVYTIDDPTETTFIFTQAALDNGCVPFDSNTATCPESAIVSFDIRTSQGDDTVNLTNAVHPAFVQGDYGADTLIGGNADDVFTWNPGGGNDVFIGGPGTDTLEFFGSNANERINILDDVDGSFTLQRDIAAIFVRASELEALELATLGGNDTVTTRGLRKVSQVIVDAADQAADVLQIDAEGFCVTREGNRFSFEGRKPIDFLEFPQTFVLDSFCRVDACEAAVVTAGCTVNGVRNQPCEGTDGDDLIVGTRDADVIKGGGGRDRIRGGNGDDLLCGGEGDDDLSGSSDDDTLFGGAGEDRLNGGSGLDTLVGGNDGDDLTGGGDHDDLDGGAGDDTLRGGGDTDFLRGGIGLDRLDGGGATDDICKDPDQDGPFLRCP